MTTQNELSRDITNPYQVVTDWLKACYVAQVNPWEYDLKNEIYPLAKYADGQTNVEKLLSSWIGKYWEQKTTITENKKVLDTETEDSDLMQSIYQVLWGNTSKNAYTHANQEIDADVIYSFWTPYKAALKKKGLKNWQKNEYTKDNGSLNELLSHLHHDGYQVVNHQLEGLAKYTHTIGNMTLTPRHFNTSVHRDYESWALNLENMANVYDESAWQVFGASSFQKYIYQFYYQYFTLKLSYNPRSTTLTIDDLNVLAERAPQEIKLRGRIMTLKLIEKLEKVEYLKIQEVNFDFDEK